MLILYQMPLMQYQFRQGGMSDAYVSDHQFGGNCRYNRKMSGGCGCGGNQYMTGGCGCSTTQYMIGGCGCGGNVIPRTIGGMRYPTNLYGGGFAYDDLDEMYGGGCGMQFGGRVVKRKTYKKRKPTRKAKRTTKRTYKKKRITRRGRAGCSKPAKYRNVPDNMFCGRAAGYPCKYKFPVNTRGRARAAKSYARYAPNKAGLYRCIDRISRQRGW